ncbi:MAG: hypothetical protein GXY85_11340 [Candidatus Brocadiaceae bacterium]|nr:hypothetical protein [Candidatus Brocadiaceae bacterium]
MNFAGKVAILPCTGIGQVVGTIARHAAYRVCEDMRPDDTVLLCLPALVRGVQEDIEMIRQCPVVLIEGCKERCAAHALSTQGGSPLATVFVPDVMKGRGIRIAGESRRALQEPELAVVELVAQAVVAHVDRLCFRSKTGDDK